MQDDLFSKFEEAKSKLKGREIKEQLKREEKLLSTPMQNLLPEIFEEKRAIPNGFLRGALFGMVRKGRRKLVGDLHIFTMSQYDMVFTGYELDQNDLEVWDTLIYLAKHKGIDKELRITLYDLCKHLRITDAPANRTAIIKRIERLKIGTLKITAGEKQFVGSLLNNYFIDKSGDGKLVIEYNKTLSMLFEDNDYTLVNVDIRHLLGDSQLARWLYNFYESHKEPLPFSIEFIQKLCRSENSPKDFKYKLRLSLELIKKAYCAINYKSRWNYDITEDNYLIIYPKGKGKKRLL
jgi:hypothetical protein